MLPTRNTTDTRMGIGPFHAVAGLFIGGMGRLPAEPKMQAVLTLAAQSGYVDDGVHHKHHPLSYQQPLTGADLTDDVAWIMHQMTADRTVLVRSEGGRERPALVVGVTILMMGGHYEDALKCVRHARADALQDFRYLALLRDADNLLRKARP